MREILFRGKRVDNGEWVYGMPCATEKSGIYAIQTLQGGIFDIIPETVGQYTGLTANGKKIFEGDIVKTDNFNTPNKRYVIKYDLLLGAFIGEDYGTMYFTTFDGDSESFEVIGSIHDDKELLEVHNG